MYTRIAYRSDIRPQSGTPISRSHPLADGLVGAFFLHTSCPWDGTENTVLRFRGQTTISPAVDDANQDVLNFAGDGTSERIGVENLSGSTGNIDSSHPLSLAGVTEFTILALCRHPSGATNSFPRIIDKSNSGGGAGGYYAYADSSGRLAFQIGGASGIAATTDIRNTGWRHVGFRRTGTGTNEFDFYLDGAVDAQATLAQTIPSTSTGVSIANWNHSVDREWLGDISWILVYDRALDDPEIKYLHHPLNVYSLFAQPRLLFLPDAAATAAVAATGGWEERRRRGRDVYQEQAERARRRLKAEAEPEPETAPEPQKTPEKPALDTAEAQRLMAALEAIEKQQAALEDVRAAAQRRAETARRKAEAEADAARRAELEIEMAAMEAESARLEAELARRRRVVAALLLLTI